MTAVRRRLRSLAAASLVLQTAWLLALVPRDCCAAHRPATAQTGCHEQAPKGPDCHAESPQGAACPLHQTTQQAPTADCQLRTGCAGPMSALLSMLAAHGILPVTTSWSAQAEPSLVSPRDREQLTSRSIPPESPPPRL